MVSKKDPAISGWRRRFDYWGNRSAASRLSVIEARCGRIRQGEAGDRGWACAQSGSLALPWRPQAACGATGLLSSRDSLPVPLQLTDLAWRRLGRAVAIDCGWTDLHRTVATQPAAAGWHLPASGKGGGRHAFARAPPLACPRARALLIAQGLATRLKTPIKVRRRRVTMNYTTEIRASRCPWGREPPSAPPPQ